MAAPVSRSGTLSLRTFLRMPSVSRCGFDFENAFVIELTRQPKTDPTEIFRLRDGLYAVDLVAAALTGLDFFTWLSNRAADKRTICEGLQIQDRPTDVMLTLFTAMGLLHKERELFSLTDLARE